MEETRPDAMEMAAKENEEREAKEKAEVDRVISNEKLQKYFDITHEALEMAKDNLSLDEKAKAVAGSEKMKKKAEALMKEAEEVKVKYELKMDNLQKLL